AATCSISVSRSYGVRMGMNIPPPGYDTCAMPFAIPVIDQLLTCPPRQWRLERAELLIKAISARSRLHTSHGAPPLIGKHLSHCRNRATNAAEDLHFLRRIVAWPGGLAYDAPHPSSAWFTARRISSTVILPLPSVSPAVQAESGAPANAISTRLMRSV